MTKDQFLALRKGDRVITMGRCPAVGTVAEVTDQWIIVVWDEGESEAVRKNSTLEVEYWYRNLDVFPQERKGTTERPGEPQKESRGKRRR